MTPIIRDAPGRACDWGRDLTRLRYHIEFLQEDLRRSQPVRWDTLTRMGEYFSMASNLEKAMQDLANETGFGVRWLVSESQEIVVYPKP